MMFLASYVKRGSSVALLRTNGYRILIARSLCSPSQPLKDADAKVKPASPEANTKESTPTAPDTLHAIRNVKPPNADEYKVKVEDGLPSDLAVSTPSFSETKAYRLAVYESAGRTLKQQRKAMMYRVAIRTSLYGCAVMMIWLGFFLPGEEDIDEVTGEIYREQPGYVDVVNRYRQIASYLQGNTRYEEYVWKG